MGCGASAQEAQSTEPDVPEVPEVVVVDEEEILADECPVDRAVIPDYWVNKNIGDETQGFDAMIYVHPKNFPIFDEILQKTYKQRVTQDRPCPTGEHYRVRGGCECVQPGGNPGLPVKYRTRQVIRVEDSGMWSRYIDKMQSIKEARQGEKFHLFKPPVMSNQITTQYQDLFAPLEKNLNEVYLFHGTRVRYALSIAQDDFRIDLAGSSRGTMYGAGAYLAESSTKADEYAMDEPGHFYEGVYALLLCRVCMGKMFYTTKRNQEAGQRIEDGSHDSTLGDRARPPTNTFRELVVYDADQLYPEYIILYQRVHANDDQEELEQILSVPFHLQLPLYWTNAHRDPDGDDGFDEQYVVRSTMKKVMQQLVDKSLPDAGLLVDRVRRVENSGVWSRYVVHKEQIRDSMVDDFEDFRPENAPIHILKDVLSGNDVEQLFRFDDIDERVNEQLLWHGGPKDGVEWMARGIEMAESAEWSMDTARFSCGLQQSLLDAPPNDEGVRTLLLCRVVIGAAVIETQPSPKLDADVITACRERIKEVDSVVLQYESEDDAQVLVREERQVYVEYIFEISGGEDFVASKLEEADPAEAREAEEETLRALLEEDSES